jgi:hypothetical protein
MRAIPVASAAVCVVAMTCAALITPSRPSPPDPDRAADHLVPDPAVRRAAVRTYARDVIAREVLAGRMALPDAAAWFGWLNSLSPTTRVVPTEWLAVRVGLPAGERCGEGEALALQVVAWMVWRDLSDDPARAQEAALRQFREVRAEGRLARLPEVAKDERTQLLARAEVEVAALYGIAPGSRGSHGGSP